MGSFIAFVVLLGGGFFILRMLAQYSQGKKVGAKVKEKALIDYKSMRSIIRKWFKDKNPDDLDEALECASVLRQCENNARFSSPELIKTAEQAMAHTYSKEILRLLEEEQKGFDLDFDFIEGKLELYNILMGYKPRIQGDEV